MYKSRKAYKKQNLSKKFNTLKGAMWTLERATLSYGLDLNCPPDVSYV